MGGNFEIESEEDKGTSIRFSLPINNPIPVAKPKAEPSDEAPAPAPAEPFANIPAEPEPKAEPVLQEKPVEREAFSIPEEKKESVPELLERALAFAAKDLNGNGNGRNTRVRPTTSRKAREESVAQLLQPSHSCNTDGGRRRRLGWLASSFPCTCQGVSCAHTTRRALHGDHAHAKLGPR